MTIVTLLVALIATSAADNSSAPVLLDFQSERCGPCRDAKPEVDKLVRNGYPVKAIDIDRSPETAQRYGVTKIPCFVVVDASGRPLTEKVFGPTPAASLAKMYNAAVAANPVAEDVEDPAPGESVESIATPVVVNPKPWQTVVRIKMHLSNTEWGFGSGTIISSSAEESIILTCAHIFKVKNQPQPRDFRVPITVDLFDGQLTGRQPAMVRCSEKDVVGEAIDYDFTNDVGLIRIKPGRRLPASRVVPPDWKPVKGMGMFTVGCSHGNDATAWDTTILDPRVGMSTGGTKPTFATIKCAHEPKQGRSGGGLYTTDGYVAGVCDFADPNEHVGLYAVPEAIHKLLDRNKLMALYRRDADPNGPMLAANARQGGTPRFRFQNQSERDTEPTRAVAAVNPEDLTLPHPSMVGIQPPAWKAGQGPSDQPRTSRNSRRPEVLAATDPIDPGPRRGEAITTDLAGEPLADARAFESEDIPSPRKPTSKPVDRSGARKGWRSPTQVLPDLPGDNARSR